MEKTISDIISYVDQSFNVDNKITITESLKNFILFLGEKDITLEDADELLKNSKMKKAITFASKHKFMSVNENISTLVTSLFKDVDINEKESIESLKKYYIEKYNGRKQEVDIVKEYLNEIGKIELLTNEQEIELAKKIENGDEEAKVLLISSNLRFVCSLAKRVQAPNIDLLDIIQDGNLGLMRAVKTFDYRRGYRFQTYAGWWIKLYIYRGIENTGRVIRIPNYLSTLLYRVYIYKNEFYKTNGCNPTVDEIVLALDEKKEHVLKVLGILDPIYLDQQKYTDNDESTLGNYIVDPKDRIDEINTKLYYNEFRETVFNSPLLTDKEKEILELRYNNDNSLTLQEIADLLGLTRERIRQIEASAINKLRRSSKILRFSDKKVNFDGLQNNNHKLHKKELKTKY